MTTKERSILLREAFPDASDRKLGRIVGICWQTFAYHTKPEQRAKRLETVRIFHKKKVAESKQKLIQFLGGQCSECGYRGYAALDFHHIDSTQKHKDVSKLLKGHFDKALEEAKKCILLCSNCHRELHEKEGTLGPNNLVTKTDQNLLQDLSEIHTRFSDIGEVGVAGAVNAQS